MVVVDVGVGVVDVGGGVVGGGGVVVVVVDVVGGGVVGGGVVVVVVVGGGVVVVGGGAGGGVRLVGGETFGLVVGSMLGPNSAYRLSGLFGRSLIDGTITCWPVSSSTTYD